MSSLNLHLDFNPVIKQEPPVPFIPLTPQERLQYTRDALILEEQIDEGLRILDRMCSAYENLLILKEHYEQYGSSPALEVLVGDIKDYLGVSLEAEEEKKQEETKSDNSSDSTSDEKGGIVGAITKIWNWFCGLFRRIGEWLRIVDKIEETSYQDVQNATNIDNSKKYNVAVIPALYKDGKITAVEGFVKQPVENFKQSITRFIENNKDVIVDFNVVRESLDKLLEQSKLEYVEVPGNQLKELSKKVHDVFKYNRSSQKSLESMLKKAGIDVKSGNIDPQKINKSSTGVAGTDKEHYINIMKLGLQVLRDLAKVSTAIQNSIKKAIGLKESDDEKAKEEEEKKKKEAESQKNEESNSQNTNNTEEKEKKKEEPAPVQHSGML